MLQRVFEFYHKTFSEDPKGVQYLKQRGIKSAELFKNIKLGYSNGSLLKTLNKEQREQLKEMGVLTRTGREHFQNCVVFPLVDSHNQIVNLYGRRTTRDEHKFLPGPQRGLFYPPKTTETILITEGVIDALTLMHAGYNNVLAIYGVNGLTEEHLSFFQLQCTRKVILCPDGDETGRLAIPRLRRKIEPLGIKVRWAALPLTEDINDYFRKHGKADFDKLLATASPAASDTTSKSPLAGSPASAGRGVPSVTTIDGGFLITFPERTYRILGMNLHGLDRLKANFRVGAHGGAPFHIDSFDLYTSRAREHFVKTTSRLLNTPEPELTRELNQLIELLEEKRLELLEGADEPDAAGMSEDERKETMKLLKSKSLLKGILADFDRCGCIGEETAKLFGYLATVSRFQAKPLGILIVSRSGAGKSQLQEAICNMVPPEDLQKYTRITGQSLFYKQSSELKYKVLAIAEEKGAEDAIYSIRTLQSDQHLTVAVTITDPKTGQKKTEEYLVEGPVVILLTTTNPEALDFETRNRFVILTIDESREQTRRILRRQRDRDSLEGLIRSQNIEHSQKASQRPAPAQRKLYVHIMNPFHKELTYPDDKLLMRRDHEKYLTLIKTIAFLHIYQRETKAVKNDRGDDLEYIEVTTGDIDIANKLASDILGRSLDELSPHTRSLLGEIKTFVDSRQKKDEACPEQGRRDNFTFTRRDLCEYTGWSYWQIHEHLQQLVAMEYLAVSKGGEKNRCFYELLWEGEGQEGGRFLMGLIDTKVLKECS